MTTILPSLKSLLLAAIRPRPFFSEAKESDLITPAVAGIGTLLGVGTILLIATAMVFFQELSAARDGVVEHYTREGTIPLIADPSPWKYLSFPVFWAIIFVLSAAVRSGFMRMLGDAEHGYLSVLAVSMFAYGPLLFIAILNGIGNNLFPFAAPIEDSSIILIRSFGLIVVWFVGVAWEGVIYVKASTRLFGQIPGAAILIWLAPWFLLIVFYALLRFFGG